MIPVPRPPNPLAEPTPIETAHRMSLISYAQNYEDVVLWRALKDVERGFYVDVGAADPDEISVTKLFYERGWSGINVEPTAGYFERLVQARPRDLNLNVAAGAAPGLMALNEIPGTGLSTGDDALARRHAAAGWESREITVPMLTLTSICECQGVGDIHFLKVDVEGAEADVLRGMDFQRFRPWIVVVEATEPLSPTRNDESCEVLLLGQRYRRAYFDGLNAFYVAEEQAGLIDALAVPPNVFDDYITVREDALRVRVEEASETVHTLSVRLKHQDDELGALRTASAEAQAARDVAEAQLALLRQERDGAREAEQRARLHADQIKRRLAAAQEEAEGHRQAELERRAELDAALRHQETIQQELLMQQDGMRTEHDAVVLQRDAALAERDALVAERDEREARLHRSQAAADALAQEQQRLHVAHAAAASLLDAVRVSTSWRLTRPMRVLGRAVKAGLQRPGT